MLLEMAFGIEGWLKVFSIQSAPPRSPLLVRLCKKMLPLRGQSETTHSSKFRQDLALIRNWELINSLVSILPSLWLELFPNLVEFAVETIKL